MFNKGAFILILLGSSSEGLPPIRGPTDKVVAHYRVDAGCDKHCHVNRNITRIIGGSSTPVREPLSFHEI